MDDSRNSSQSERIRQLERLVDVNRSLCTSLDLEPFLHTLIAAASELTNSEAASILEPAEEAGCLRFLALPWFHRDVLKPVKVPLQESLAGWVYRNGQTLIVEDIAADSRHFKGADQAAGFTTLCMLAAPILYQGQVLGVLEVLNKCRGAHYTEEDRTIVETLAAEAAVAIQNNRLINKVQKHEESLAELNRVKSEFIGIASHELRTPLGLILGHATFLREIIEPVYHTQMDIIVRNCMRLKDIIDNMASMDNIQNNVASLHSGPLSIKQVVQEVMDSFQTEAIKKRISLRCQMDPQELMVQGDGSKISIALSNLVQNALHYSNPDGHVLITAEQIPGNIKVSVIDDGIGIPAADLPHVFERFYQVEAHQNRKHEGMGLGLSVAKVMIEMHGGRIWAESVEAKGSNFTFILPVAEKTEPASPIPNS
jgi:signal transduction histidine kinase